MQERLQKLIAASGRASRRAAEQLIRDGRVQVNGKRVLDLGSKADPEVDAVLLDGIALAATLKTTYLLYKPRGVVCSRKRQGKEPIVTDLVPSQPSVFPVGRLDKDSEGLILLSNDGALTQHLTHPSFEHKKEYTVSVKWQADAQKRPDEWISQQLLKGVKLGDGKARADAVSVESGPEGLLRIRITVHEGRTHLIRRMCAILGLDVTRLIRTRIDSLGIQHLKPGAYRVLSPREARALLS